MTLEVDNLKDSGTGNTDAVQDIIDGRAKAWAHFNQSTLIEELNHSSLTDISTGEVDLAFTNNFANNTYAHGSSITNGNGAPTVEVLLQTTSNYRSKSWYPSSNRADFIVGTTVITGTLA